MPAHATFKSMRIWGSFLFKPAKHLIFTRPVHYMTVDINAFVVPRVDGCDQARWKIMKASVLGFPKRTVPGFPLALTLQPFWWNSHGLGRGEYGGQTRSLSYFHGLPGCCSWTAEKAEREGIFHYSLRSCSCLDTRWGAWGAQWGTKFQTCMAMSGFSVDNGKPGTCPPWGISGVLPRQDVGIWLGRPGRRPVYCLTFPFTGGHKGLERDTSLVARGSSQPVKIPKERKETVNLTILLDCSRGDNEATGYFSGTVPSRKKREWWASTLISALITLASSLSEMLDQRQKVFLVSENAAQHWSPGGSCFCHKSLTHRSIKGLHLRSCTMWVCVAKVLQIYHHCTFLTSWLSCWAQVLCLTPTPQATGNWFRERTPNSNVLSLDLDKTLLCRKLSLLWQPWQGPLGNSMFLEQVLVLGIVALCSSLNSLLQWQGFCTLVSRRGLTGQYSKLKTLHKCLAHYLLIQPRKSRKAHGILRVTLQRPILHTKDNSLYFIILMSEQNKHNKRYLKNPIIHNTQPAIL